MALTACAWHGADAHRLLACGRTYEVLNHRQELSTYDTRAKAFAQLRANHARQD